MVIYQEFHRDGTWFHQDMEMFCTKDDEKNGYVGIDWDK